MSLFSRCGRPFFPLGGQSHNSSAYNAEEIASAIGGLRALSGNTLEAPVYWEQIEPEEGRFGFAAVDSLLASCRAAGVALVVLWFGTWKNGEMRYVPEWVKRDRRRFARVVGSDGVEMEVLSSHCSATLEADRRAFVSLMGRLKELDPRQETLIAVQVENEPGILGSDRDYGADSSRAASAAVPAALLDSLDRRASGPVWEDWKAHGGLRGASWTSSFGERAFEYEEAWSIARFIDAVAASGRAVLDVPCYANAWLYQDGWPVPGFYPAGGPVTHVLDIWKAAAPHLVCIAPDIYVSNPTTYRQVCSHYGRDDNPFFVPESGANDANAMNMLRAVAEHGVEGYCCFGVDSVVDIAGAVRPEARLFTQSFAAVKALLPLLPSYRGTGRVRAVLQEEGKIFQAYELERYIGAVPLVPMGQLSAVKDHRHGRNPEMKAEQPVFGLIVETGPYELYLAGHFHLHLIPRGSPAWSRCMRGTPTNTPPDYLSVEEGRLEEDGSFVPRRRRNGDEVVFGGFWSSPLTGVTRVRLAERAAAP